MYFSLCFTIVPMSLPCHPSVEIEKFPYLKNSEMSKEQRSDLVSRLEYESKKISREFQILVAKTALSLKQNSITVSQLRILFSQESKIQKVLRMVKDLDKALLKLSQLWSFFDYEMLGSMINGYCSKDEELLSDLKAYIDAFEEFCKRRVCEVPSDAFPAAMPFETYLHVKVDRNWKITLNQVKNLEQQISDILQVKLHLLKVKDGCVELVFIPMCTSIEPLSPVQQQLLRDLGVIEAYEDTFTNKQEVLAMA